MEIIKLVTIFGNSEQPQGLAALGLDLVAILAQTLTFLLLFFVVKKYALEKIVNTLEDRRKTIESGVRLGRKMEAEQNKLSDKIEKELKKARSEADNIIAQSKEEASGIIRDAEEATARKVQAMLDDAHAKIEEDIATARKNLEKDVRILVANATGVILEEKLDAKKDMSLIDKALAKVRGI